MKTYYHINKNVDCNWSVGDEIIFGAEDNHLWRTFAETNNFIEINGVQYDVDKVVKTAFEAYIGRENPPIEMKGYHFTPLRTLDETINSLFCSIRNCRELAFEAIRKEYYPELPNRKKCIWLIPNNDQSLKFWMNTINSKNQRIFKVSADGNLHRAAQKWLIGGTYSLNKWDSMAHSYWKGEDTGGIEDELLFEGKIRIIEEIDFA